MLSHSSRDKFTRQRRAPASLRPEDGFVAASHRHVCGRRQRQDRLQDNQGNEKEKPMANALGYVSETNTGFEGMLAMMNFFSPYPYLVPITGKRVLLFRE